MLSYTPIIICFTLNSEQKAEQFGMKRLLLRAHLSIKPRNGL